MSNPHPDGMTWQRRCADKSCAEVAKLGGEVFVRSSERPDEIVKLSAAEWAAFLEATPLG